MNQGTVPGSWDADGHRQVSWVADCDELPADQVLHEPAWEDLAGESWDLLEQAREGPWPLEGHFRRGQPLQPAAGAGPMYRLVGPLVIFFVWTPSLSIIKVIVLVVVWVCTIYCLLGTFWILPFQLLITLVRWASELASGVANRLALETECQAHQKETRRPATGYQASLLTGMEQGSSLYPHLPPAWRWRQKKILHDTARRSCHCCV